MKETVGLFNAVFCYYCWTHCVATLLCLGCKDRENLVSAQTFLSFTSAWAKIYIKYPLKIDLICYFCNK